MDVSVIHFGALFWLTLLHYFVKLMFFPLQNGALVAFVMQVH